ncbi:MAG: hypothetical protein QXI71_05825 [Candidatus Bathyarchaeia archaeon]
MIIRVKTWEEFKRLIIEHKPKSLAYNIAREAPSKNFTCLRLILPTTGKQYVFVDNASGNHLRKTGIKLNVDESETLFIKDEDVVEFVRTQVNRKDLNFYSYWTT